MDPIVAALWSSLPKMPPASIPTTLDCILASTAASPASLFSELLHEFPRIAEGIAQETVEMESDQPNCVLSYVAALSYFLKKSGGGSHDMDIFVWKVLMPLLKLVHPYDNLLFFEVASMFLDVVAETNCWDVIGATIVPLLLRSIGLSMGTFHSEKLAMHKWTNKSNFEDSHDKLAKEHISKDEFQCNVFDFPLPVCCKILTMILDAALKYNNVSDPGSMSENMATSFAGYMLWDLSNFTLQMISYSLEHRSCAVKSLLPFIFKAFSNYHTFSVGVSGVHHVLTRKDFFFKIWETCKSLFSLGSLERRDAYDILSLYSSFSPLADEHDDSTLSGEEDILDLRADPEFWDEMKRGLLDKESLVRKQSLHILKTTLNLRRERKCDSDILLEASDELNSNSHMKGKRGKWAHEEAKSLGVGKICSQTEVSVSSCYKWEVFILLYEMLEEYGTHLVEAAWNHQIVLWLQSSLPVENPLQFSREELYLNQMATAEQIFGWLIVLWERGFCHDNPQVRCLIMQSFFAIQWESYGVCSKLVPEYFILGPLMRGLNDPVHHREFGVKEKYSSHTIEAASRFLHQYASSMGRREHTSFLVKLSSVPLRLTLGRVGLMCLAECIASTARGVANRSNHGAEQFLDATVEVLVDSLPNSSPNDKTELLDALRFVLECSKHHFNPKYRLQVCERILAAAAFLMDTADVPLEILLHFLSSLPREYTDYGGSLRYEVQKWLGNPNLQLLKAIHAFPVNFICYQYQLDSPVTYDDEEINAWESEARRWARVLFLAAKDRLHFDPIIKFIQNLGGNICKHDKFEWEVVKFLILVCSLVDELVTIQERIAKGQVAGRMEKDFDGGAIFDEFARVFLSFLEELVSFAKLSISIFWLDVVLEETSLPGAIKGKLGGPSLRRLSSTLCTSVLEAITSIKTLVAVLKWCAELRTDVPTYAAQVFLWTFCLKTFATPAPKSEVEGEIYIAAYEACTYALEGLVPIFSTSSLNSLANNDSLFLLEEDREALLDVRVSTFMNNLNIAIDGGNMARTRRAVLMNLKWRCLESLLLLPKYAQCNGIYLKRCRYNFSQSLLKQIFDDLVGSLENAGEVSVLPMLRSIRLTMEMIYLRRMDQTSSWTGITIEMMWLLVHSSWILHVSCNKRRVAPIAALLSCVLHSSVFGDERMHESDNVTGPLKWFVEKILEEGKKSPRTIRLAALHLCGLWLACPNILKYYITELKLLTLYGSVAFDEDFEAELAENYDARAELSVLSKSLDPELTDVFINTELYARVSVAVLFSRLADMADLIKESTFSNDDNLDIVASGKMFLIELLNSVITDRDLSKELYKKYSAIHRRKVRAWQMICVLSRFVDRDIFEQVTSCLQTSIYRNNLPSVRHYMETFGIYIYLKFPLLISQQLVPLLRNYDLRPQAVSSYVFIAANIILHAKKSNQFEHLDVLLPPIVPFLTSHHHNLRGVTQILVYQVLQMLFTDSSLSSYSSISLERRCFDDLRYYLAHNSDCARLRASMDRYLGSFDPVKSISPAGIFTTGIEEHEFECVPTTLMDQVNDFLNNTREDLRSSMAKDAIAIKHDSINLEIGNPSNEVMNCNGEQSVFKVQNELLCDFQRKITFSWNELQHTSSTAFMEQKQLLGSVLGNQDEITRTKEHKNLVTQFDHDDLRLGALPSQEFYYKVRRHMLKYIK
ncbi:uncharacterized protein LOC127260880 isoform X3 [Andrographis paniculata]|uniref:uncharacterized protein LOC127260880 isoform X2 n=1 Tax=Andrographis paniculata TaxID=175694 RepID=UPI0021E8610A|nr:uncharacterized protein LOC127260880 isoform X2 [Andrographis paniculata]XP_051144851.1 uncharacterized protein LOC127260880 isoform X3 [Andrographis paniculata]